MPKWRSCWSIFLLRKHIRASTGRRVPHFTSEGHPQNWAGPLGYQYRGNECLGKLEKTFGKMEDSAVKGSLKSLSINPSYTIPRGPRNLRSESGHKEDPYCFDMLVRFMLLLEEISYSKGSGVYWRKSNTALGLEDGDYWRNEAGWKTASAQNNLPGE